MSENKRITDGNYDKSLAVKCNNGTFVGKKTDEMMIWKGIPYATQPVGKLRWQKALPAADDDGVYGRRHFLPQTMMACTKRQSPVTFRSDL